MDLQLCGKRALLTGGTKGIGRAVLRTLVDEGCTVSTCARTAVDVNGFGLAADQIERVDVQAIDLSDTAAYQGWIEQSIGRMGGVDIVIANVSGGAEGDSSEAWYRCVDIDLMGAKYLIDGSRKHLADSAEEHGDAAIVATSSVSASLTLSADSYGAVKAALIHYVKGVSKELARAKVRANTVSPGTIYFPGGDWHQVEKEDPQAFAKAISLNPTGRMGTDREVADLVTFLASPRASFVSGANVVIDGALTSQIMI